MKRYSYSIDNPSEDLINQMINWAQQFSACALFHSNNYPNYPYSSQSIILAADQIDHFKSYDQKHCLKDFQEYIDEHSNEWLFGGLSYDIKNTVEDLHSHNFDGIEFPLIHFFQGKHLFFFEKNKVNIESPFTFYELMDQINNYEKPDFEESTIQLKHRIDETQYLTTLRKIKQHISNGDIYEINFCQEFYAEEVCISAIDIFRALNDKSKAPFASYLKLDDVHLMCSSPERYLKRKGNTIISQPIKGTAKRGNNKQEDDAIKEHLKNSLKEQSENVMIVDLVRNDLSRKAKFGSIKVEELFEVYTFDQVHQMISTIKAEIDKSVTFTELIETSYPMGSMTGAPKVMAMQLIEEYEQTKRGLFSGSVGFIQPNGDFDLNVIIRSILYNEESQYLSIQTGGAITHDSIPEDEYAESLLKAKAMKEVLCSKS